jgi:predicted HTH transcriptional regulator
MLPDAVREMLEAGESETVEFKRSVPPVNVLARLTAGFANARGGFLLLGVEEHPVPRPVGVDADRAEITIHRAIESLSPVPEISTSRVMLDGTEVVVVEVAPTRALTLAPDGLFKRVGASVRPFTPVEAVERIASEDATSTKQEASALAQAVARLTEQLDAQAQLLESLIKANHWSRKALWVSVGAVAGAVAKILVSLLMR